MVLGPHRLEVAAQRNAGIGDRAESPSVAVTERKRNGQGHSLPVRCRSAIGRAPDFQIRIIWHLLSGQNQEGLQRLFGGPPAENPIAMPLGKTEAGGTIAFAGREPGFHCGEIPACLSQEVNRGVIHRIR